MAIKILVVDDEILFERVFNRLFKEQIKNNKYKFHFATSGKQALEKIISGLKIDIMLVDIRMPDMDGLALLEELNNRGISSNIIIVSAYADIPNFRKAMNEGAFDFLVKPIEIDELEESIDKLFSLKKQSIKLTKSVESPQAARIKTLLSDPSSQKVTQSVAYKIVRQLPTDKQLEVMRRLMEGFSLDTLTELKYELEAQEYIEIENQENKNNLAVEVYQRLGFDETKLPLIALEQGFIEERLVKRNRSSGDVKNYGIHLYLRWKEGTSKTYYLGPIRSLDERTKTLLSLMGYSLEEKLDKASSVEDDTPNEDDIPKPETENIIDPSPKPKPPLKLYGKDFKTKH